MSVTGGNFQRNHRYLGENRLYSPPHLRKYRQKQEQEQGPPLSENRPGSSSDCSISSSETTCEVSNLCRFLEHTTPHVPAQYLPKRSKRRWKTMEAELHPYFVLGDLWESFKEWSAYGAGVPLVLNGGESVTQYYNVSLSAIQLYVDPSKPSPRLRHLSPTLFPCTGLPLWPITRLSKPLICCIYTMDSFSFPSYCRRPSQESDSESARETSSDSSSGYCHERGAKSVVHGSWNLPNLSDASNLGLERVSLRSKPFVGSSSDESESCNPLGELVFEYFENETPYNREPLADKIYDLARQFPELKTYRSCDLSPASWVSLAWYPIYRIPNGPTLQSLSACFLTFHSLSTALQSPTTDGFPIHSSKDTDMSSKLSLPIFGLAFHKLKVSVWDPDGVSEGQKANSLLRAADNWIRLLQVNHPDYNYFMSRYSYWR